MTELSDAPGGIWFALGLIRLMRGETETAAKAYETGLDKATDAELTSCLGGLDATIPELDGPAAAQAVEVRERIARALGDASVEVGDDQISISEPTDHST